MGILKNSSLNQLEDHGYLKKNLYNDINRTFLPWLHEAIVSDLKSERQEDHNVMELLEKIQADITIHHASFVKKEMDKRKRNLEERIRVQKELEAARKHRKERRIAKRKMKEKTEIYENLKKFVINYPTNHNDILDAEITEITGEKKRKPIGKI